MPKNALVVGAPRSGTSLTASIFAAKNYYVAEDKQSEVRSGDSYNPFGYWEASGVIEMNVEVFKAVGYEHHNTWTFDEIRDEQARAVAELDVAENHREFVQRYEEHAPWMWKDPRLCYTLGYWWKALDPKTTGVLLVTRNPEAVYKSFQHLKWADGSAESRAMSLKRIQGHFDHARAIVRTLGIPHVSVDYDEYVEHPAEVAARIGEHFELEISVNDLNVRRDLNHSTRRAQLGRAVVRLAKKLPRGPVRLLARLLPRRVVGVLFPEGKYTSPADDS